MVGKKKSVHIDPEFRWCTNCQQQRPANSGSWSVFNGGTNRRWRCDECSKKHAQRTEQLKQQRQELMIKANRERAARDRAEKEAKAAQLEKKLEQLAGLEGDDESKD